MAKKSTAEKKQELERIEIAPGMTVCVHQILKEKNSKGELRERIQIFEGLIIARRGGANKGATFTVRKISGGVGVEKIYPLYSPAIAKIELVKAVRTRRAKLFFVRSSKKRLKEIEM